MMMHVMLSVPKPSHCCRLVGQFVSIIISTTVASPLNLLLSIAYCNLLSAFKDRGFFKGELPAAHFSPGDLPLLLP